MAVLVILEMCDSWLMLGGVMPARTGRKVVSVGRIHPVTIHMVSLRLESSLGT